MAYIAQIRRDDRRSMTQVKNLLEQEGITLDANLDATCGVFDENDNVIATGSCFQNTLRCFAVDHAHQGEGLMNQVVGFLMELQAGRGNFHLFVYTKCSTAKFFTDLGFHEIARVEDKLVFLENRRTGFSGYLRKQKSSDTPRERTAAIVMNANPFTLGHLHLVERASRENDAVHLFIVSEDASLFPFAVRKRLVMEGTAHLRNLVYHDSGPYIISSATFPSYFLKDESAVIDAQAGLDAVVFTRIADALHIGRRYVGEEPTSVVTAAYNRILQQELPKAGVECIVVPRAAQDGVPISASTVRQCIRAGDDAALEKLVPPSTMQYLRSDESKPVRERICAEQNVVHY